MDLDYAKAQSNIGICSASLGHCTTAFNGCRCTRDQPDGAKVVRELELTEKSKYASGFWQMQEGDGGEKMVS